MNRSSLTRWLRPTVISLVFSVTLPTFGASVPMAAASLFEDSKDGTSAAENCGEPGMLQTEDCTPGHGGTDSSAITKKPAALLPRAHILAGHGSGAASAGRAQLAAPGAAEAAPPTEFQIFVQQSIGTLLPIYGSGLFENVPSTFAPLDHVPVSGDYVLGPGDQIEMRIWGQINAEEDLTVDRQGNVFVPQVGRVNVAGLQFAQLPETLRTSIGRVFRNFELSVDMGDLRSIEIFVMGHARRPGTYTVSSLSTLVNALFASGGPSPTGSMRNIQLQRGGKVITTFDLYDLLLRGDKSKDVSLKTGDVIFIAPAGARVAVGGSVETSAIYEISPTTALSEVLSYAGGLSPVASGQRAVLERINTGSVMESQNLALTPDGLKTPIQNGDIISLQQVVPRFEKTVTLKGNVADAVRLPWRAGMKISDVIPEKRALLTRNYWKERNRLTSGDGGFAEKRENAAADSSLASIASEDKSAVVRAFNTKNDVEPPAPDINWNYAAIERLDPESLSTKVIPFNLGRVVCDHDDAEDLSLEPGDVITIFSSADFITPQAEQTRLVRLEGEVKTAGIYSVHPGETLRSLLTRAGGLTDKAYVFGSLFSRLSTKAEQQRRLSDYIDRLERDLDQSSSELIAHSVTADQGEIGQAALENQHRQLERLRTTDVSGRIVLSLNPESAGVNAFPDMPLENGDRLVIPSVPFTVSVVGTVYNESTFLHKPDLNIRACLEQAGGPTRFADRTRMFLVRADGSVVSRTNHSGFENLTVYPGDTVVVPAIVAKASRLRSILDLSQSVSGLGVGAAAVNVLR